MPEPTDEQKVQIERHKLEADKIEWKGDTLYAPYWGGEGLWAIVNPHGSVTVCPDMALEVHLSAVPE